MKLINNLIVLLLVAVTVSVQSCKTDSSTKTLKLAHGLDVNHSVHKAMVKMAEDVDSLSNGQLKIQIYPSQQLGTERQCLELLQVGSLDMTKVSVGVLENFAPKMRVLGLPFMFRNRAHAFDVLDGEIGQQLLLEGKKYWLHGLGYYDAGSRSFYTKEKPVYTPVDLEGQKIRVMESATAMNMVKSLGGSPTPISWGELYTALQQGVVDGAENNPPSFYLSKHYEVCKYYSINEHTMLPDVLLASTHSMESLTAQQKKWLEQAVNSSVKYQRELWLASEKEAIEAVKKAGVEVIYPDKYPFAEKVETLYASYKEDKELEALIEAIKSK